MPDREVERIALHYSLHSNWGEIFNEYHRRKEKKDSKKKRLHGLNLWLAVFIVILTMILVYFQILVPFYGAPIPFKSDKNKIQTTDTIIEQTDTQKGNNVPFNNKKQLKEFNRQ